MAGVLLMFWLGACVVFDLRSRQVPAFLTLPPLFLAAIWRLSYGEWALVLLVAALVLISDLPWVRWRIPLACLASVIALLAGGPSGLSYAVLVILAVWAMWETGATGGADAKIIITLVLLFADGMLFIPIVLIGGIQGLIGLMARQKTIPYTVSITLGTAAWLWLVVGR